LFSTLHRPSWRRCGEWILIRKEGPCYAWRSPEIETFSETRTYDVLPLPRYSNLRKDSSDSQSRQQCLSSAADFQPAFSQFVWLVGYEQQTCPALPIGMRIGLALWKKVAFKMPLILPSRPTRRENQKRSNDFRRPRKGRCRAEEKIEATETNVSSERQIESNKLNARLSTGPRTIAGKQKIAANALKHGLTGEQIVLPDENPTTSTNLVARSGRISILRGPLRNFWSRSGVAPTKTDSGGELNKHIGEASSLRAGRRQGFASAG
jgi:hypothetical protein